MFEKNILVIAAHPDDEVLGCGGTLAKFKKKRIQIVYLSDGVGSRDKNNLSERVNRKNSAIKFCNTISKLKPIFFDFPDNEFDSIPLLKIIKKIENVIGVFKPDTILTHSSKDLNIDHQITSRATITATRPNSKNKFLKTILFYEILSSTECNFFQNEINFNPTVFIDIDNFIKTKIKSMNFYKKELRKWPHPRSIENIKTLAKFRGSSSNLKYAEAFEIGRLFLK